jgi:hypothetical protein
MKINKLEAKKNKAYTKGKDMSKDTFRCRYLLESLRSARLIVWFN